MNKGLLTSLAHKVDCRFHYTGDSCDCGAKDKWELENMRTLVKAILPKLGKDHANMIFVGRNYTVADVIVDLESLIS